MAYGNKISRVVKEAEFIMDNERYRFVPLKQAPFAKHYEEEASSQFNATATPSGKFVRTSWFGK